MTFGGRSREVLRSLVVVGFAFFVIRFALARVWRFTIDDSGIVYAYAKRFASGQGPRAVVGGPIVEGYSDFSWVALLSVATGLGFDTPAIAKIIGSACFVAACGFAAAFVRRLTRPQGRGIDWPEALPAVFMALCPEFVVWAPSGLENALYWALMMLLLWLDLRESERPSLTPWSVVAAVGICITRPEGVLYAAVVGVAKLVDAVRMKAARRQFIVFAGLGVAALGLYHAVHYATFRSFVPNTYYAKAVGSDAWAKGEEYVRAARQTMHLTWAFPLALVGCTAGLRRTLPALCCALAALWFATHSGGDWMPHYRFVGFAVPPLVTLAAVGVARAAGRLARAASWIVRFLPARIIEPWLVAASAFALFWLTYRYNGQRFDTTRYLKWCHFCSRLEDAQDHIALRDRLGLRSASMLTHDFGGPAFASSQSFMPLDVLGLCDQPIALLTYEHKRGNLRRFDFMRGQYFLHERDAYPTFLYFPDNFWGGFAQMPESRFAYLDVALPARSDGRVIARTRLARAAFVDFFPSVEQFAFRDIDERFVLVGSGAFRDAGGAFVMVFLGQKAPSTQAVELTARASGIAGAPVHLFGAEPKLAARFFPGEPLFLRLPLPPAAHGMQAVDFTVVSDGKTVIVPVGNLSMDALGPRPAPLPFPNNLPGTSDAELIELGAQIRDLVAQRHDRGDLTLKDPALGRRLVAAADRVEKSGATTDAYLALVWAAQADPDQLRFVYRRIAARRPARRRAPFLEERALLGAFYVSHDPLVQLELVHFYAGQQLWDKARYFADRLPPERRGTAAAAWTRELSYARRLVQQRMDDLEASAVRAVSLAGAASDFEGEQLGWKREGAAFNVVKDEGQTLMWGVDGEHYFSSENESAGGRAATGRAESPSFVVDGRLLTFLVAGDGGSKLSAELVVDGKPVLSAAGSRSRYYSFPVVWDLLPFRGKTARLVLSDSDPRGFIAVDHLRIWPELPSAP
jgi:hypothetical protein